MRILSVVVSIIVPLALAVGLVAQPGFRPGELFLYTPSTATNGYMLLRIDPRAATAVPLVHFDYASIAQALDGACYDPFRDRILVSAGLTGAPPELWAVDSAGRTQSRGHSGYWINKMTSRGDGIVYCVTVPGSLTEIRYLDASDNLQPLMDASGVAPFVSPRFTRMIYHPGQNALFLAENAWYPSACAAGTWTGDIINVHRVPLAPNGTQVAGPVTCTTIDISNSAQAATGWSLLPGGDLLLVIDTNSNSTEPRMQRIDPVTLAASTFASSGSYIGTAAVPAGVWSNTVGAAVVVDSSNHVLRAYGAGAIGPGVVLPPAGITFSNYNHGVLRLFEIGPVAASARLAGSPGEVSLAAGGVHSLTFDAGAAGGSMYWILGSFSGWNPGFDIAGVRTWLLPDFYTNYTISSPNAGILGATLGGIMPGVTANATVTVPAGSPAALAGIRVHHCAVVFDAALSPLYASNPVSFRLVP
ncbi:MAG: hypothetical protein NXI31_08625 [bacterium]|nr:hypothetical protein [bacterium]